MRAKVVVCDEGSSSYWAHISRISRIKLYILRLLLLLLFSHDTPVVLSYYRTCILIFNALVFKIFTNLPGIKMEY